VRQDSERPAGDEILLRIFQHDLDAGVDGRLSDALHVDGVVAIHHVGFEVVEGRGAGVAEEVVDLGLQEVVGEDVVVVAGEGQAEVEERTAPAAFARAREVAFEGAGAGVLAGDGVAVVGPTRLSVRLPT